MSQRYTMLRFMGISTCSIGTSCSRAKVSRRAWLNTLAPFKVRYMVPAMALREEVTSNF